MNPLTITADRLLRLRAICQGFPEAVETEAWGDPTWRVRGKIFAMQKGNYAGGRPSVWVKSSLDVQSELMASDAKRYFAPPYVGHKGWVAVHLDGRVPWKRVEHLIEASYRAIAPKRLVAELDTDT